MKTVTLENPLCIALDSSDEARIVELARQTTAHVGMFKVGLTAYVKLGREIVARLSAEHPVFLDLKLHDIPAQVAGAAAAAAASGAAITTVHASGGVEMMQTAVEAAGETRIVAVTVLTSLDASSLARIGIELGPAYLVDRLADAAIEAGVAGLVCSPHEVATLRARYGSVDDGGPLLFVPGIRAGTGDDDQKRTMSATDALAAGADVLVVGRPITAASDPAAAAAELAASLRR